MLKARLFRFIRRTLGPDYHVHTNLKPVRGGGWLPAWIVARSYTLDELRAVLDSMGGPYLLAHVRDPWPLVVLTHVIYFAFWLVSAAIFAVVRLAIAAASLFQKKETK